MLKPALETHIIDGTLVAEFWDCLRLDPAPVQDLRGAYEKHATNGGTPNVIVDLSGVGFAGSAALGNFVALNRATRQRGGGCCFATSIRLSVRCCARVNSMCFSSLRAIAPTHSGSSSRLHRLRRRTGNAGRIREPLCRRKARQPAAQGPGTAATSVAESETKLMGIDSMT